MFTKKIDLRGIQTIKDLELKFR